MTSITRKFAVSGLAIGVILLAGASGYARTAPAQRAPNPAAAVSLKYKKFQLPNGLTVIVHEDHQAPVVAVAVWYGVGSADEPDGKTGFAHLFEHLMFSGSENHKAGYFIPFERVGATDMNGMTEFDHTIYYETVPTTALDMALWMESDRMGHLLGAIGQAELDTQRGVVQNEIRQRSGGPYGRVEGELLRNAFPANHAYHHDTGGSMADLNAASLEDVKGWFRSYYGAANTTLVLAGDISLEQARAKARQYFGDIPSGPPVARQQPWIVPRGKSTRTVQHDQVEEMLIAREWNVPQRSDPENILLKLAATVLGGGAASRLDQRLVRNDRLADSVTAELASHELAGMFKLSVIVPKGIDSARVEGAIADEWAKFLKDGPTGDELARAKSEYRSNFLKQFDSVGQTANLLASYQTELGDPSAYRQELARIDAATPAQVLAAARKWLSRGDHTLTVIPAQAGADPAADDREAPSRAAEPGRPAAVAPAARTYSTTRSAVDRTKGVPEVTTFPNIRFPEVERGRLKNGMEVILARRSETPVIRISIQFDAGYAADQGRKTGTETFVSHMLDEGTTTLPSLEIAKQKQRLGAEIGPRSDLDTTTVRLRAMNSNLAASLALFADVVRNPAFQREDMERIRQSALGQIAFEKAEPSMLVDRILPPLLYGRDHPYGIPASGSGTSESFKGITRDDMVVFHRDFYRPDNAKIFVVGDTTLQAITALLDKTFGDWRAPSSPVPRKRLANVPPRAQQRVFLIDRKGATQSTIAAGLLSSPTDAPGYLSTKLANDVFGGAFTARINQNLRENKRWSYGAYSSMADAAGQRALTVMAAVQTDKTAESMTEILKEIRRIASDAPPTAAEVNKVKVNRIRALPGAYADADAVLHALETNQEYRRPDNYVSTLKGALDAQTEREVAEAAKRLFVADAMTWLVIGDLAKIEQAIRALNIGSVTVLDQDGKADSDQSHPRN